METNKEQNLLHKGKYEGFGREGNGRLFDCTLKLPGSQKSPPRLRSQSYVICIFAPVLI